MNDDELEPGAAALQLLAERGPRRRPLDTAAEARVAARLEAAFRGSLGSADDADVDLVEFSPQASAPVRRRAPLLVAAAALVVALVAAMVVIRSSRTDPPVVPADRAGRDLADPVDDAAIVGPLSGLRGTLTGRPSVELFRVDADGAAYWRTTTLPEYDGETFRLPQRPLERVDGLLDEPADGSRRIRQEVEILSLGGQLVPAAAEPVQAEGEAADGTPLDLRLNRDTSTLVSPDDLLSGALFTIVSAAPQPTAEQLRKTTSSDPPDVVFTELPDDLPRALTDAAAEVTTGAPTAYDAAIALQGWFRSEFTYGLEAEAGHSGDRLAGFLDTRVGFAEQFSTAFAVMARTLGVPSRVAVGYMPGELDARGWYRVLGSHAHAWPELWFDDIGWVAFEPTPGRGAAGAESR